MSANKDSKVIGQFITSVVDKPHVFFNGDKKAENNALMVAKHFYDKVKKIEPVECSPFNELLIKDFDNDQIWEEIAAQNEPFLQYAKSTLKSFSKGPVKQANSDSEDDKSVSGNSMDLDNLSGQELSEDSEQDEEMEQEEQEEEMEQEQLLGDDSAQEDDQEIEESAEEIDDEFDDEKRGTQKSSEVDDQFFNLEKFNKWTEEQEELDMNSDREDDGFNFDDDLDGLEDSEDEMEDVADLNYNDFYGQSKPKPKKVRIVEPKNEEIKDEDSEGSVRDLFADEEEENEGEMSAFQKQQERLMDQIEQFEDENVQDKHWTLRGEATAGARPVNSLLEEDLEFEHANKPVPVITEETTNVLEDLIKKRILENMFDDVERKADPNLRPFLPSKRVELKDEKSKKSLAEIYEDDFSKKKAGDGAVDERDEALEKEHEEITDLFNNLCVKLDALSNFHYTPKAPKPEMVIISNAAAISMEEVIPVNVSEGTLLAPEELYEKKRNDVKAVSEMDQDERKRLRAQKKKLKRKENDMKEKEKKILHKYNPKMAQKEEKTKAVKDLLGQKNVTIIGKDGKQKTTSKTVTSASLF